MATKKPARKTVKKTVKSAKVGAKASALVDDDGNLPKGHTPPPDTRPRISFPIEGRHWDIVAEITGAKSADDPRVVQLAQQLFRSGVLARKREIEKALTEQQAAKRAGI